MEGFGTSGRGERFSTNQIKGKLEVHTRNRSIPGSKRGGKTGWIQNSREGKYGVPQLVPLLPADLPAQETTLAVESFQ